MNIEIDTTKPGMDDALKNLKDELRDAIYKNNKEISECKKYLDGLYIQIKKLEEELQTLNSNRELYESKIAEAQSRKEATESILEQIKEQEKI